MSGKIITRVRERQWATAIRLGVEARIAAQQAFIEGFERKQWPLWHALKNWRQWFFKNGSDGGA